MSARATQTPGTKPSSRALKPTRGQIAHALSLIGRTQHGDADDAAAAARALADWRAESPVQDAAADIAQSYWAQTDGAALRERVAVPKRVDGTPRQARRQMLTWLGVGGLAIVFGGVARRQWLQPTHTLALRTGKGEVLPHTLPDGSVVTLAPHTDVQITYYRNRREFQLSRGGLHLDVQPDTSRPLSVATQFGNVRVLGTVFTVALRDDGMDVAVAHGRVAVWARSPDGRVHVDRDPDVTLAAGQAVTTLPQGIGAPQAVTPRSVGAWREGWLVFQATPLPQAIAQWNDFLAQPAQQMRMADADAAALRGLRLTGTFPVSDPAGFLQGLPTMLPVRVRRENGQAVIAALR
ncbi:histidine kinase [Pandoraea pneumonica]|jgi:transmembrane sensor|uniref:Histidine kinase n=1 Tax=Pandoraea pneumonica TaxID=2508299 RepID=A0A5E4WVK3_9BURK|nr:FecR domain-containing protein [Pandoraea pneumonica]VVE27614.1 histidine kinase [Pandoraea pneumonica]